MSKIFLVLYDELKLSKIGNKSIISIRNFVWEKLRKAKDTKIDSIPRLQEYHQLLTESFLLQSMTLGQIQNLIQLHAHAYTISETHFSQSQPALFHLIRSFRPLKEVSPLSNALLPIFFENVSPDFLPVSGEDRVLTLTFPPASLSIHWVKYIYIVDLQGQVKISPEMLTGKQKGRRVSHSQLAGWGPVQAAGEIYFSKINNRWHCMQINNGSGHYEPDARRSLLGARQAIAAALSATNVGFDPTVTTVRNVLLPGVPAHSFLRET